MAKRVVILQKSLPQYRKPLYELLKKRLQEENIELVLIYGNSTLAGRKKNDLVDISWAIFVPNKVISLANKELYWQPITSYLQRGDLVIVEQASKLLVNYYIQFLYFLGYYKLAFWGHGKNLQINRVSVAGEQIKKLVSRHVSWWFAYTEKSKRIIADIGFPEERITVLENSIDTNSLRASLERRTDIDHQEIRERYNLTGENICVFCGGMYREKCISFLLEAASLIKREVSDFTLVFIGSGEDKAIVEEASQSYDWIHYLGSLFDEDKVDLFSISKLSLMPGLVGLGILDAFALGLPIVTTDVKFHSPEIDYLENGKNGIMTPHNPELYAQAVIELLSSEPMYERFQIAAQRSGQNFSIEKMADNFASGIILALNS